MTLTFNSNLCFKGYSDFVVDSINPNEKIFLTHNLTAIVQTPADRMKVKVLCFKVNFRKNTSIRNLLFLCLPFQIMIDSYHVSDFEKIDP